MKKLMTLVLLAVSTVGCTTLSVEEEDYDNEIQVIDKDDIQLPDERGEEEPPEYWAED